MQSETPWIILDRRLSFKHYMESIVSKCKKMMIVIIEPKAEFFFLFLEVDYCDILYDQS